MRLFPLAHSPYSLQCTTRFGAVPRARPQLASGVSEDGGVERHGHQVAIGSLQGEHVVGNGALIAGQPYAFRSALTFGKVGRERRTNELGALPSYHTTHIDSTNRA